MLFRTLRRGSGVSYEKVLLPAALPEHILRRHLVLVVEDDPANRMIAEAVLTDRFHCKVVTSAEEAMAVIEDGDVTVLLADHRMPGKTGIDLCEWARKRYPKIQRILLTAYTDPSVTVDAINRGGVSRFLVKPCPNEELVMAVGEAVARAELERRVQELERDLRAGERGVAMAALQRLIIHDLANVAVSLQASSVELREKWWRIVPEELREVHGHIEEAVLMLHRLHERARLGSTYASRPERHRVAEAIAVSVQLVRSQERCRASVRVSCPDDAEFFADQIDVSRVLVNLLSNALQAIAESGQNDGRIDVDVETDAGRVIVTVRDNGPGIPEERRNDVFESGWTSREDHGGSGLGLAICKSLAEANGGGIELVASDGPGATFVLRLPAPRDEPKHEHH